MQYCYPVALVLEDRPCLVVGAGRVAERRLDPLLQAGARVHVVAPQAASSVQERAVAGGLELSLRPYRDSDLDGVFLALVATGNADLNAAISAECRRRGILVNVADQPALCTFYVPATVQRGPLSIAVSSSGGAPALSKHLRLLLEETVGEEYGLLAELMQELRPQVRTVVTSQAERAAAWERLLASEVLELLRQGSPEQARHRARELVGLQ